MLVKSKGQQQISELDLEYHHYTFMLSFFGGEDLSHVWGPATVTRSARAA